MSGRVVGRIFERRIGSPVDKAVLLCLGEHSNPDGEMSFPPAKRIALETELGISSVRAALSRLRKRGLIIQTARAAQHRPAIYRVSLDALSDLQVVEVYKTPDLQETQVCEKPDLQDRASRPPGPGGPQEQPSLTVIKPSRPKNGRDAIRKELELHFAAVTRLPSPEIRTEKQRSAAAALWYDPLRRIAEVCQWDEKAAKGLITQTVVEMRKASLTISSPKSILNPAMALLAERRSGEGMSSDERFMFEHFGQTKEDLNA